MAMEVGEAMGQAIRQGAPWVCMVVARAHPARAFEEVEGQIPALWLAKSDMFPKACKELMAMLDAAGREAAVEESARHLAEGSLRAIMPCMVFQEHFPEIASRRRLRREAKLAKGISKLIAAAGAGESARMREAASRGVASGLGRFARANPTCGLWLAKLGWGALADRAMARAERKWIKSGAAADPAAKRAPVRI